MSDERNKPRDRQECESNGSDRLSHESLPESGRSANSLGQIALRRVVGGVRGSVLEEGGAFPEPISLRVSCSLPELAFQSSPEGPLGGLEVATGEKSSRG